MKPIKLILLTLAAVSLPAGYALAHCQIPCGIYADDIVFGELMTDQETIAKSMRQIQELEKDPSANANQLIRWVNNKEDHAQKIQDSMAAYFLAQRIKLETRESDPETYNELLGMVHKITVLAMKCKQTTDLDNAEKLHNALHDFQKLYSGK